MKNLLGSHVLSVNQFDRELTTELFKVADRMIPYATRRKRTKVLDGAILGSLFFEPSTRTRVSFGSAFNLLGGFVRETVGAANSSLAKGESLWDTAQVMSGYADVIAMRHPESGSVAEFAEGSRVPVLNGGDGSNEHPTQALLDLYTIQRQMAQQGRQVDGMKIALVGDLKYGRTVHSLSKLLRLYNDIQITLVAPDALQMPEHVLDILDNAGHRVETCDELAGHLNEADFIYMTRVQEERFETQEEADRYRGRFRLDNASFSRWCRPEAKILHPLPRDSRGEANELDNDLNNNPALHVFQQADNGVLVRMALFACCLGVQDQLEKYETEVNWHINSLAAEKSI